ncbi:MAG: hypothetical protein ACTSR0_04780 [Candidatus Asgardarchaeia archaeon]
MGEKRIRSVIGFNSKLNLWHIDAMNAQLKLYIRRSSRKWGKGIA